MPVRACAVLLALLLALAEARAGAPALVTTVRGEVALVGGEGASPAPVAPFVLAAGQRLEVPAGGMVVVLHAGNATQVHGPASVDPTALDGAKAVKAEGAGALSGLLSREVSTSRGGASRSAGVQLVRPVAGTRVIALREIRWSCDGCGAQDVEVVDFASGETLWTGRGEGALPYGGPPLAPGAYALSIGGRDFVVPVIDEGEVRAAWPAVERAVGSLRDAGVTDPATLVAVPAGVYLQADLPSEALWLIDGALREHPGHADLKALRALFEARAGLGR